MSRLDLGSSDVSPGGSEHGEESQFAIPSTERVVENGRDPRRSTQESMKLVLTLLQARKYVLPEEKGKGRTTEAPKNVCILALVFRMGTEKQNVMFMLDPWKWFVQSKMTIEAEGMYVGRIRGVDRE